VAAVVSLDAGIMFQHNLVLLRQFAEYDATRLRAPLLQVTRPASENAAAGVVEDLSLFRAARFSDTYLVRLASMRHEDFTTYGFLWHSAIRPASPRARERLDGYLAMRRDVAGFLDAYLKDRTRAA